MMEQRAKALKLTLDVRQSNHEGVIVDWIQEAMAKASAVVINAGAYAHSSIAIRDAVAALPVPVIEVHLTNIYAREGFRRTSLLGQVTRGSIIGFGPLSYVLALDAAAHLCKGAAASPAKGQIQ
jgi:3-dehydroquinate dehydratase-2